MSVALRLLHEKMFGFCGGLGAVSLFVNRSAMFLEAVFKSTFGFSFVLFPAASTHAPAISDVN